MEKYLAKLWGEEYSFSSKTANVPMKFYYCE